MGGLGHNVSDFQIFPSNESRVEFPAMAQRMRFFMTNFQSKGVYSVHFVEEIGIISKE